VLVGLFGNNARNDRISSPKSCHSCMQHATVALQRHALSQFACIS